MHFSSALKLDKYYPHKYRFGIPEATFSTIEHDLHGRRRAAVNPFFSKRSIVALEPLIRGKIEKLCTHLDKRKLTGEPLDLRMLFPCLTADIITEYVFPKGFDYLSTEGLAPHWRQLIDQNLRGSNILKHYPVVLSIVKSIPDSIMLKLAPSIKETIEWERTNQMTARTIVQEYDLSDEPSKRTIFHELLSSDLPLIERSYDRLWQEASSLVGAGTETTANTLTVIMYHLLANPSIMKRLKAELTAAIPDPELIPSEQDLQQLPYLSAVISEGLHKAPGVSNRLIRVAPSALLNYGGYVIPPGTAVSMNALFLHKDRRLFPDPEEFDPERWFGRNSRADLFCWSAGPRNCLGMK